jgi:hypothetical protein
MLLLDFSVQNYRIDFIVTIIIGHVFNRRDGFGDKEIGPLANCNTSQFIADPHGIGAVYCGCIYRFFWEHSILYATHRKDKLHVSGW